MFLIRFFSLLCYWLIFISKCVARKSSKPFLKALNMWSPVASQACDVVRTVYLKNRAKVVSLGSDSAWLIHTNLSKHCLFLRHNAFLFKCLEPQLGTALVWSVSLYLLYLSIFLRVVCPDCLKYRAFYIEGDTSVTNRPLSISSSNRVFYNVLLCCPGPAELTDVEERHSFPANVFNGALLMHWKARVWRRCSVSMALPVTQMRMSGLQPNYLYTPAPALNSLPPTWVAMR